VRFLPEDHDRCEIDERALAMTQARIVTPGGTAPAAPPPPAPPPVPDPTQAPDPETDLARTMQEAMAQGNVTWAGNAQVIDARNVPGLRDQMVKALQQYGIQMPNMPTPGVRMAASSAAAPGASPEDDPVQKLEKLSALHKSGVLTDEEFQAAKAKALGQL
jgi:hypothetical protein